MVALAYPPGGTNKDFLKSYPEKRASNDTSVSRKSNMGADPRLDPSPTEEIEDWREDQQKRKGNPTDERLGPNNDKGVDPVLGWPNETTST
jgi:hypothetical protein